MNSRGSATLLSLCESVAARLDSGGGMPPISKGYRPLLTEPGIGITSDEDKLRAQVGEPRPYLPQFDADDGSVVDW